MNGSVFQEVKIVDNFLNLSFGLKITLELNTLLFGYRYSRKV